MRILVVSFVLGLSGVVATATAQEDPRIEVKSDAVVQQKKDDKVPKVTKDRPMSFWMQHKLDYSKSILESLTMGEYKKLATTAEQMRLLGKLEGFVRRKNSAYRIQLRNFDLAAQELVRHAKQENPDGATLAFNQMTASCVACHTLLRKGIE